MSEENYISTFMSEALSFKQRGYNRNLNFNSLATVNKKIQCETGWQ